MVKWNVLYDAIATAYHAKHWVATGAFWAVDVGLHGCNIPLRQTRHMTTTDTLDPLFCKPATAPDHSNDMIEHLRWQQTRKLLAYRESTHTILSVPALSLCVTCLNKILVYSVLEHINTTSMYTISWWFITYINIYDIHTHTSNWNYTIKWCIKTVQLILLIRNRDIHGHNTRCTNKIGTVRTRHEFAKICIRYSLVHTINSLPSCIQDKIFTHSLNGLSLYSKHFLLNKYESNCQVITCYTCN